MDTQAAALVAEVVAAVLAVVANYDTDLPVVVQIE
jgi:hypothetical protein